MRRRHSRRVHASKPKEDLFSFSGELSKIEQAKQYLQVQEEIMLKKALSSSSPTDILGARRYLESNFASQSKKPKSYLFDPLAFNRSLGYKEKPLDVSYSMSRAMARTPIIKAIVGTRTDSVAKHAEVTADDQKTGWTIAKKNSILFPDKNTDLTDQEKYEVEGLINFLLDGGVEKKEWIRDFSFETFLRKITPDSLVLDQMTFETVQTRNRKPHEFFATDGATYRLAPSHNNEVVRGDQVAVDGCYPYYVQLYQGLVSNEFYPWELCFGIRNQNTNIYSNGYGTAEIEDMVKIVTWMLYQNEYNGRFFSQGSASKGFLFLQGEVDEDKMEEFKQMWRSQISGVENAWKVPMMQGGTKMEWIDMQKNNKDMEFSNWQNFLILIACALYKIDPSEIGFHSLSANEGGGPAYEANNEYKLQYSKDKGLIPLLKFIQNKINKYLIGRFYNGKYEFRFTGIDDNLEDSTLDSDIKKLEAGIITWEEVRVKYNLPAKIKKEDFLLNSIWIQYQQMKMGVANQSSDAVDGLGADGSNPFEVKQPFGDLNGEQDDDGNDKPNIFHAIKESVEDKQKQKKNSDVNPFMKSLNKHMEEWIGKGKDSQDIR